jgi:hypothetical protein
METEKLIEKEQAAPSWKSEDMCENAVEFLRV